MIWSSSHSFCSAGLSGGSHFHSARSVSTSCLQYSNSASRRSGSSNQYKPLGSSSPRGRRGLQVKSTIDLLPFCSGNRKTSATFLRLGGNASAKHAAIVQRHVAMGTSGHL